MANEDTDQELYPPEGAAQPGSRLQDDSDEVERLRRELNRQTALRRRAEGALRKRERFYETCFERAPDPTFVLDTAGVVLKANAAAARFFERTQEELLGCKLQALFSPTQEKVDWDCFLEEEAEFLETCSRVSDGESTLVELKPSRIVYGGEAAVLISACSIERRKAAERALEQSRDSLEQRVVARTLEYATANERLQQEVAEREQAEQALRESERRFSTVYQLAPVAIAIVTLEEGRFLDHNECFTNLTGYDPSDVVGLTLAELELIRQPQMQEQIERYLWEGIGFQNLELQIRAKSDGSRDVLASAEVIELIGERCGILMLHDITERKRLEREVLEISEDERRRIGHDLHDDLGQQLTGVLMLSRLLQEELEKDQPARVPAVRRITSRLGQALAYVRHLSHMLSPVVVEAEGLMDALESLAENTDEVFGIPCWFEAPEPVLVGSHEVATHLYRIAQEAVNNAVKHGRPGEIGIELLGNGPEALLRILDNGVGISDEALQSGRGIGLHTMHYRADIIGADLTVRRREQGGTVAECRFRQ